MKHVLFLIACVLLIGGCSAKRTHDEFVRSITFSNLATFSYGGIVFEGLELERADEVHLRDISGQVLKEALAGRGFELVEESGDFSVIVVWRKAVSAGALRLDPMREEGDLTAYQGLRVHRMNRLYELSVEMFESSTGYRFWEKRFPRVFSALELSESRIEASILRAVQNFPDRVFKDPNLPDVL